MKPIFSQLAAPCRLNRDARVGANSLVPLAGIRTIYAYILGKRFGSNEFDLTVTVALAVFFKPLNSADA
jgi:hypothetical protein